LWVGNHRYLGISFLLFLDFKKLDFKDIAMVILMFWHQPELQFLLEIGHLSVFEREENCG
jgi:hypothetical protein